MSKYFRFPFAVSGDRTAVPDPTQTDGSISYQLGYTVNYQLNQATDSNALDIDRREFNQTLFDITGTLQQYYQRGVPPFITSAMNGGAAYSYSQYARVLFNNRIYESLINNNTTTPTNTTNWRLVDFAGMDARYLTQTTADGRYIQGTLGHLPAIYQGSGHPVRQRRGTVRRLLSGTGVIPTAVFAFILMATECKHGQIYLLGQYQILPGHFPLPLPMRVQFL